jgi:hypothetical protein
MKYRYAIAACARWETAYIVEWLNYYRAIGFGHVFLYCNDDDPAELYERVLPFTQGPQPFVTFRHHPHQGEQPQMYGHFLLHNLHECEWVGFFDLDEFLRLPAGDTIADFMGRFDASVDCVLFNWIFFGPNGHREPPAGPVLANYTKRSGNLHPLTKYVAKSVLFDARLIISLANGEAFWHTPQGMSEKPAKIVNVLGEDMRDYYARFEQDAAPYVNQWQRKSRILSTAFVHHYAFRSEQSFWERSKRGLKGSFDGQTIWRDLAEGSQFSEFLADVNAVSDTGLADFWLAYLRENCQPKTESDPLATVKAFKDLPFARLRLGIAITTMNRCAMVLNLVQKIRELTETGYDLVICDDGSHDETVSALTAAGETVISGRNRGIAWNKNRGIYYLLNVRRCDVILLLDDDVMPTTPGWEREWIKTAWKYGHVNYLMLSSRDSIVSGSLTSDDPGLSSDILGCAIAFSRIALAQIGYMDIRFGRYGNEHTQMSFRAVRVGFGGITVQESDYKATYFYVIEGGIQLLPSVSSGTQEDIEATGALLQQSFNEPTYCHAWLTADGRDLFLQELEAAPKPAGLTLTHQNHFASLADYRNAYGGLHASLAIRRNSLARGKPATQSSVSQWSRRPTPAEDAAGAVNGQIDGRRKFHTELEVNPWWQVDLGAFATIDEIHIYNTVEETANRFTNFSLAVSIDGIVWVEITRKADNIVVGGLIGGPYIWNGPGSAWGRFVRITLLGQNYLHLDQVEVYGTMA